MIKEILIYVWYHIIINYLVQNKNVKQFAKNVKLEKEDVFNVKKS